MNRKPIEPGLFRLGEDGSLTLIGGFSPTSGQYHFPLLDTCPYSGAGDVEEARPPRVRQPFGWTTVTLAPPGYQGPVPYGFGIVELVGRSAGDRPGDRGRPRGPVARPADAGRRRCPLHRDDGPTSSPGPSPRLDRWDATMSNVEVEIAGVGMHPFGRFEGKSVT